MKVNIVTQNYYPNYQRNNVHFGQTPQDRKQEYINAVEGGITSGVTSQYPNVVDYIFKPDLPHGSITPTSPREQAKRDYYIGEICGDGPYNNPDDDDLDRTTY
jgi:hypothetical protein